MKTPPIKAVKDRFGDKEKLVSAVKSLATQELWLDRVNEEKGLGRVSNAKLLRLHEILTRAKKDFGSREKLVGAILTLMKRTKDEGLRGKLEGYPTPRLLDLHDSTARRAKAEQKAKPSKAPAKKKLARSKKAKAKAKAKAPKAK